MGDHNLENSHELLNLLHTFFDMCSIPKMFPLIMGLRAYISIRYIFTVQRRFFGSYPFVVTQGGFKVRRVQTFRGRDFDLPPRCTSCAGYNLHGGMLRLADVRV